MAVSVFNYLISSTPVDGDNPFGATPAPAAPTAKNEISSGEAFLQVLEQVRNGKTEKTSEAVFNKMSSHAETSASAKKIGSSDNKSENVRVLKLHFKRTRASSRMAQEDAVKAQQSAQDRQKIPTTDTMVQQTQTVAETVPTSQEQVIVKQKDFEQTTVAQVTETTDMTGSDEDFTAADVLLMSYLPAQQPVQVQEKQQIDQTVDVEIPQAVQENNIKVSDSVDMDIEAPVQTKPVESGEAQPDFEPVTTDKNPVFEKVISQVIQSAVKPIETKQAEESNIQLPETTIDIPVENQTEQPVEVAVKQPVETEVKTPEKTVIKNPEKIQTAEPQQIQQNIERDIDFDSNPEKTKRRNEMNLQETDLAAKLPSDAKIAIHVEQNAAAKLKVSNTENQKTARPLFGENLAPEMQAEESADITIADTKPASLSSSSENKAVPAQQQSRADLQPQIQAAPIVSGLTNEVKTTEKATIIPTETAAVSGVNGTTASQPAGQALFNAPNELKGKATPASTAPAKQTPTNELVDQIKVKITKAVKDGVDKIEIVLRPKELGSIRVRFEVDKDGNTNVHLTATRAETIDMLQKDISALKQALNDAGMNMSDNSFTFNYRGEEQQNSSHEQKTASFLHNDIEDTDLTDTDQTSERIVNDGHALNIRV